MFEKILIANRGEIACRVMRTAQRMGIQCVAVYSDADANAMHVKMADEAWHLGGAAARDSYLKGDLILEIAKKSGAQAIHPGYGFLSENAEFADLCEQNGIVFIGPHAASIRAMGSKAGAKEIMGPAGVPLVKGYHGDDQSLATLQKAADDIGYPVLIKAVSGGGGKGMRQVFSSDEFAENLKSCQREAKASFNDERVLVEKYLTKPRHVEIQVFADTHGHAVYLFERDCSVQRRHQKIIEEAPAPLMKSEIRQKMGEAAVRAAKAVNYVGAGTCEFLLDEDGSFYFMEMNTRLQVEHPVTEMITGQDLVEWQLRVAAGEHLPLKQEQLRINGHAFEARIYAEDPDNNFLPSTGTLHHLRQPQIGAHVRVDTGVEQGDTVSIHYDPMIAKLIVWDESREKALARLRAALAEYEIVGLTHNIRFLHSLASHPEFIKGNVDTGFIKKHEQALFPPKPDVSDEQLAIAALFLMADRMRDAKSQASKNADCYSPWADVTGWRMNEDNHHQFTFIADEKEYPCLVHFRPHGVVLELPTGECRATGELTSDDLLAININGKRQQVRVVQRDKMLTLIGHGWSRVLQLKTLNLEGMGGSGAGRLTAPMPGSVIDVKVKAGDEVKQGQALLVLEAMKMEHTIRAPADGRVAEVMFAPGDMVQDGVELVRFEK
ncbi:acetyl/propionyl/methylcrotonyl-CoA carboxylase subunit alpha [Permianibacter aggregans]|uniref:Biotin carboxylase n=1 Tax=Permianibacter aggregans TaxID=1510150 RepID=A0A4R6UFV2_9GAMM|nr:acetyl/propionyl/methylcrotonyl-CoA carboxylase subunit alpha [Permianibacter aggregans]QGX41602.1 acetyl/propionyl/methylcrotonyl-CoA carboxylase subunit alpha [Permianibacter aggregans]TDQ45670.1 3-methylcrotonoyl-CoA carboxylase alpha subunit [Permianibacter aggregans]